MILGVILEYGGSFFHDCFVKYRDKYKCLWLMEVSGQQQISTAQLTTIRSVRLPRKRLETSRSSTEMLSNVCAFAETPTINNKQQQCVFIYYSVAFTKHQKKGEMDREKGRPVL